MRVTDDIIIISKCMQEHGLTKSRLQHAHFLLLLSIIMEYIDHRWVPID